MLPLPPLDGGRVAVGLLPDALARPLVRLERHGMLLLIALIFVLPVLGRQLGVDLDVLSWLLSAPTRAVIETVLRFTGNA